MKILRKIFILKVIIIFFITNIFILNVNASPTLHANQGNIVNVGVLFANLDNPFWQLIDKSLNDMQNKTENKVRFTSYDGKNNISTQFEQIDSLIRNNTNLLVIKLADSKEDSIRTVIDKAISKNIPVIFLNVDPLVSSKFSKYYASNIVFMAEDFIKPAALQGKLIAEAWNADKQNIDKNQDNILQYIILSGERGNPIAEARTQYSIAAINTAGIETQQLAQGYAKWDREIARQLISQIILQYDDRIEAIIANSDSMAIGAVEALQSYGYNKGNKSKNIIVVGFDGLPEAKDLIDKGFMTGTIAQDPATVSEAIYAVGMNLINNRNPLENTNYKLSNSGIVLEFPHYEYINKSNVS